MLTRRTGFFFLPFLLAACLEPRLDKNDQPEKFFTLKLIAGQPPEWARHYGDMPQFTPDEQKQFFDWFAAGKIEVNPPDQVKDFQFVNSVEKLISTGEANDIVRIQKDLKIDNLADLVPTQFEIYWGNVAAKVVDTLSSESKFSACDGSILTALENGRYYILDGHHRWASCLFVRRFLGKAEEFRKLFSPFRYYEDRKIYELLNDAKGRKLNEIPDLKITVLEGNAQGISRALYELAKLGHGRFDMSAYASREKNPLQYLRTTIFLENPLMQWLYFALAILSSFIISRLFLSLLKFKVKHGDSAHKRVALMHLVLQTFKKYIYSVAFLISINLALPLLTIPPKILESIHTGLSGVVIWLLTIFSARLFANAMLGWQERIRTREDEAEIAHLFPLLIRVGKGFIYFVGALFILNRAGYNIYSAIAGLSVGGFALAMAGRETVGHIFAGISLYLDKVIKEGDYLLIDSPIWTWGKVEKVGIRSTTIRTKYNSILVIPNSTLANYPVNNVTAGGKKRMYRGKILLAQDTPFAAVERAVAEAKRIITAVGNTTEVDVHFMKFDAFGFYIRVQYFVEPYTEYHDTVSRCNLAILKYLNEQKIALAVDLEKLREKR